MVDPAPLTPSASGLGVAVHFPVSLLTLAPLPSGSEPQAWYGAS